MITKGNDSISYSIVDVDEKVDQEIIKKIESLEGILKVNNLDP